jgi:hypothetical protein
MARVFLTIVLPLVLPTVIYFAWAVIAQRRPVAAISKRGLPWLWLAGAGLVLAASVLALVAVRFSGETGGVYIPAHLKDGKVVPGHFEPAGTPP